MKHRFASSRWLSVSLLLFAVGCGDNLPPAEQDAAPPPDIDAAPFQSCGDGLVQGTEECDDSNDSNDDACLNDCTLACGDGVVNPSELCDTGIAAGELGACPSDCDDSESCTIDALAGDGCQAECLNTDITGPVNGDGCCPPGEDANTDDDCTSICGNSIVESPDEVCDTGIAAGSPGACPVQADCADGAACTADILDNAGTCSATCRNEDITMPQNGDGCCPAGANVGNDDDCSAMCGDGILTPGDETCDIAIPAGMAGTCPTACTDDMDSCTTDALTGDGTCQALCTYTDITVPDMVNSDMCCPPTGNANNDIDCTPVCGNGATEPGEACDDGNTMAGDGCDDMCQAEPTAFRIESLTLRDPHTEFLLFGLFCTDITGDLNTELANAINGDADSNGFLDFSVVNVFRPLDQAASTNPLDIVFADCTDPVMGTSCSDGMTQAPVSSTATNMAAGTCLEPIAGTTSGYMPAVTNATGPCYASDPEDFTVDLSGILIPLTGARIGATYVGSPATDLVNGLLLGFVSETDAENTIIPASIPFVGGSTLASILPGGMGNCSGNDDRDIGPDGMTSGWWLYFNFTGTSVTWTSL